MAKEALTGLIVGTADARWARGELTRGGWSSTGSGSVVLPAATDEENSARNTALRDAVRRGSGEVVLGLPVSGVLLRALDLPSIDDAEIEEMLSLQVDQFLPLPQEEMVVSHEVLARRGDSSLILVAATPAVDVEAAISEVVEAGARVAAVDSVVLGWLSALKHGDHIDQEGRQILLVLDAEPFFLVLDDGLPVVMRRLASLDAAVVEREAAAALMSAEVVHGSKAVVRADVVHPDGDVPQGVTDAVCEACGVAVTELVARDLAGPAAGIAARAMRDAGIDLYPPQWRSDAAKKAERRKLFGTLGVALVLWLLTMTVMVVGPLWAESTANALEADYAAVKREADKVRVVKRRVDMVMRYKDRSEGILECMDKMNNARPEGVLLDSLGYEYGKEMVLNGRADRDQLIYQFKNSMDAVDIFEESDLVYQRRLPDGKELFEIKVALPQAARGAGVEP